MSKLQLGLIVLGAVVILLVLGLNWWQEHRVRRRMQAQFSGSEDDALLKDYEPSVAARQEPATGGQRREPGLGGGGAAQAGAMAGSTHSAEPELAPHADDADEVDPVIEVVIEVGFAQPVSGAALKPALLALYKSAGKPLRVFATTDQHRHCAAILSSEHYETLQVAALLANRSGPLTDIEWSRLWNAVGDLAERFEASVDGPDQADVVARAKALDTACAALDSQVGLTLALDAPRPLAQIARMARDLGFMDDGKSLAWMSDQGVPRFVLLIDGDLPLDSLEPIDRVHLLLDVPRSPSDEHAFSRMVDAGRQLASALTAELIDDQGRPVAQGAETVIDEHLTTLYGQLDKAGLPAGQTRALRVFA